MFETGDENRLESGHFAVDVLDIFDVQMILPAVTT
jgi:hypothetical protein